MISVIVPVYNVEKYIAQCIESILQQTYTDFELILIDDGSTDKCNEICSKYVHLDKRVKLICKANGGLSSARNTGINASAGEYITFVDSDDYISKYMLQALYDSISKNSADIAMCSFKRVKDNQNIKDDFHAITPFECLDAIECFRRTYGPKGDEFIVAWAKLYKRKMFQDIRYPEGKIHEDEFVTYKLFATAKKIVYIHDELYFYRIREQSIMHSPFSRKSLVRLEAYTDKIGYFESINEFQLAAMASKRFILKSAEYYIFVKGKDRRSIRNKSVYLYNRYKMAFKYEEIREKIVVETFVNFLALFWLHYYFVKLGISIKKYLMKGYRNGR